MLMYVYLFCFHLHYLYKNEEYLQSIILQITTIRMHFTCQMVSSNISQARMSMFDTIWLYTVPMSFSLLYCNEGIRLVQNLTSVLKRLPNYNTSIFNTISANNNI